jgi:hypothetical protein
MESWESVINTLCGDAPGAFGEVASALGQSPSTLSGWKKRGIPSPHWAAVVALGAERRAKPRITLEALAELAARKFEEARA